MSYELPGFLRLPSQLLESGLTVVQAAAETAQSVLAKATGQKQSGYLGPAPLAGPADIDTAMSDLAARAVRILRSTPMEASEIPNASASLVDAVRRAFCFVDLKSPTALALPFQLALSATSLAAQSCCADWLPMKFWVPTALRRS